MTAELLSTKYQAVPVIAGCYQVTSTGRYSRWERLGNCCSLIQLSIQTVSKSLTSDDMLKTLCQGALVCEQNLSS